MPLAELLDFLVIIFLDIPYIFFIYFFIYFLIWIIIRVSRDPKSKLWWSYIRVQVVPPLGGHGVSQINGGSTRTVDTRHLLYPLLILTSVKLFFSLSLSLSLYLCSSHSLFFVCLSLASVITASLKRVHYIGVGSELSARIRSWYLRAAAGELRKYLRAYRAYCSYRSIL